MNGGTVEVAQVTDGKLILKKKKSCELEASLHVAQAGLALLTIQPLSPQC